nr:hypothetical protein [Tanacetum cinerariifolium]
MGRSGRGLGTVLVYYSTLLWSGNEGIKGSESSDGMNNEVSKVSQGNVAKSVEKIEELSASRINVLGDMPVPFSENVRLNPGGNVSSAARNDGASKQGNGE